LNQVKKTRRVSAGTGKRKAEAKGKSRPEQARRGPGASPVRIPVRGARKSKVKPRLALDAAPRRQSDAELAETRALAVTAMDAALDKHGLEPVLIDVSAMGSYTDFIGIVSGRSDRQVDAIADNVCDTMRARGCRVLGQEGTGSGRWTLLDFGAFVVHVFYHPVREFYDLESLWIEAPRVKLDVPASAQLAQADALYGAL
jgi:ribosome-associated protein